MQGRDYVLPDDIKALAEVVLAHRVMVNPSARLKQVTPKRVIADLLQRVPMPDADLSRRSMRKPSLRACAAAKRISLFIGTRSLSSACGRTLRSMTLMGIRYEDLASSAQSNHTPVALCAA